MKFFFDNNLSRQLAEGMKAFGEEAVHLREVFDPGEADAVWLRYVGEEGLFLVTRDERIRFRPNELAQLKAAAVGAFFLGGKNRNRCELIQQLVRNWPRMKKFASRTKRPFACRIPPSGSRFTSLPL